MKMTVRDLKTAIENMDPDWQIEFRGNIIDEDEGTEIIHTICVGYVDTVFSSGGACILSCTITDEEE